MSGLRMILIGFVVFGCAKQAPSPASPLAAPPRATALSSAAAPAPSATTAAPSAASAHAAPPAPSATPSSDPAVPTPSPAAAPAASPRATLDRYYHDLNRREFEAARYFAPSIKRYITMKAPTPESIDRYLRKDFPKQFESYEFLIDEPTLHEDGPNALVYTERCLYYLVKNREFHNVVAEVRVEFDDQGRIVDFHHLRVIGRDVLPEKH